MMRSGKEPSVNSKAVHTFSRVPSAEIPRSQFDRSHGYKTTFDAGYLVPVFVDEALPGDTFSLHMTSFTRVATLLYPIMDNMFLESFFFFVPNRLLWTHWEQFNGYQANPGDSISYLVPTVTAPGGGGFAANTLADYFGLPTAINSLVVDALPFRAYNLIWNEWFRDENMQNSLTVETDDGPDTYANYTLQRRGKRYDYFTSCLPYPQKSTTTVSLPLGSTAPVYGTAAMKMHDYSTAQTDLNMVYSTTLGLVLSAAWPNNDNVGLTPTGSTSGVVADLTHATAANINDIRLAFQTQKLLERDARGGTRYTEIIRSHFGVISPDMRLQRPEYLGGGSTPVTVNPIAQTSSTSGSAALADLAAYGICATQGHGFTKSFTEHGIIIGMICVRADLNYQQGMNRMWSRQGRYDFYWPALSHIGEQAVLNKEIYSDGSGNDALTFGYQERYAEYRYKPSLITGQFRSNYSTPLDGWHLAQDFGSLPALNSTFIVENPPISRVIAVSTDAHFLFDSFFSLKCVRPMPVYAVPGLIDHF